MQVRGRAPLASRMRGLVLLELLVAGCVLALLAALAAPSFAAVSERLKLRTAVEALTSGIYAARAEAYKRGGHVVFAAADACDYGKTGSAWSCGWLAFADDNDDGKRNGSEEVIFVGQPPTGIEVAETRGIRAFRLNALAKFNGLSAFGFALTTHGAQASAICVSSGGRVRVQHGKGEC